MTTHQQPRSDIEHELADRLGTFARAFVADLDAQGRLVGPGGAGVLERLRIQVEARRNLPEAYQAAVDTIVEDCGYPSEVAVRIAAALRRKGILGDDDSPEAQQAPEPAPGPPTPAARGAQVVTRIRPAGHPADADGPQRSAVTVQRVEGQVPQIRPVSALPQRPADWDDQHARAVSVAAALRAEHNRRLEVLGIAADGPRVLITIRAASLSDWEYWLAAINTPVNITTKTSGHTQLVAGHVDGIDVHLAAHDVPRLLTEAKEAAGEPFYLWGRMYDLTRGYIGRNGHVWLYFGQRQSPAGMPLVGLRGGDGQLYPLASVVMAEGHLTPAPAQPTAVAEGGEQ